MDRKLVWFLGFLLLGLSLGACASAAAQPAPTAAPTGEITSSSQNPFPLGCVPDQILLNNLKSQLPFEQTELIFQSYGGENTLVVWLVDPFLGTSYTAENEQIALETAVGTAQILDASSVCIGKFDLLHITVVSADFTRWFSGAIRPEDVVDLDDPSAGGSPQGERGSGMLAATASPPELARQSDCDLPAARQALDALGQDAGLQLGSYYVRDENGDNFFIHWVLPEGVAAEDSLQLLEAMLPAVTCLVPRPDGLSITVAGEDGVIVLTGYLPGSPNRRSTDFDLDDLTFQRLDAP